MPLPDLEVYTAALIELYTGVAVDRALCRNALIEKSERDAASSSDNIPAVNKKESQ